MNNTELIIATLIGSSMGTLLVTFLKSYSTEKGKNAATKEDVEKITASIESAKDPYNKALEDYKGEVKKAYDVFKPSLDFTINIDKVLIKKIAILNESVFQFIQFGIFNNTLVDEFFDLASYLVQYQVRYKDLPEVKEILVINNKFSDIRDSLKNNSTNPNNTEEIRTAFTSLTVNLQMLLGRFLPTMKP
jgi:hypothetical protein